jgi:hypothetical protein
MVVSFCATGLPRRLGVKIPQHTEYDSKTPRNTNASGRSPLSHQPTKVISGTRMKSSGTATVASSIW